MRQLEINEDYEIICDLKHLPDSIIGDELALEQILDNLLSNAVKYSPNGPKITVRGWCEGSNTFLSISDRGVGIDEEELPKMFGRFFRASTSAGIPGTGIGLNLAKSLVELHDGSIYVESKKGHGSTFTVRLPIDGPSQKPRQSERVA